jgi:hypothetical protein
MWKELLVMAVLLGLIGRLIMKDTAFWALIAMLVLPLLSHIFGQPAALTYTASAIVAVVIAKRATANWEAAPERLRWHQVLASRIIWDRDVPNRDRWTARREL